jgi:hypothetical protein
VQSRVQRPFLHSQHVGYGFNLGGDPVAMERTPAVENLESQQRKGTLKPVLP